MKLSPFKRHLSGVTLNFTELESILDITGSNPLPLAESLSTVMQELKLEETKFSALLIFNIS